MAYITVDIMIPELKAIEKAIGRQWAICHLMET